MAIDTNTAVKGTTTGAGEGATAGSAGGGYGAAIGGLLGAVSGFLSSSGGQTTDPYATAASYAALGKDVKASDWSMGFAEYGVAKPYGETPVTPYQSTEYGAEAGYYYDNKRGVYVDAAMYQGKSKKGRKALTETYKPKDPATGEWVKDPATGKRVETARYTWIPARLQEGVSDANGQLGLEEKDMAFKHEIQPAVQDYTTQALAEAIKGIPVQGESDRATWQGITDTAQGRTDSTNATNLYTTNMMPQKQGAVETALLLAGRNTEEEAARQAGAEVAQAFNTKQQTLGESIRRTGAVAGSGRMAGLQEDLDTERVKATAGARTAARTQARANQFDQLSKAIQYI